VPAPIIVFAYNRPDHLAAVLAALAANEGADRSKLFIFCDGPRMRKDEPKVLATRHVAHGVSGFLDVSVIEQKQNRGLSASIMLGVGEICDRYGSAIVLEDDVVPTPYFLGYVNAALDRYRDQEDVFSIGCHTFDAGVDLPETFFLNIPDCWGWAIWQRSWKSFQPDGPALLEQIIERGASREFDVDGSYPYTQMLKEQVAGGNQSWAIRLYAHTFLNRKLVLYPRRSVTSNIGFDGSGTHSGVSSDYLWLRTADRPIAVSSIDIQESMLARAAWKAALGEMADTSKVGIAGKLRFRLGRMYRTLGPYVRKVLP
jgi:hypothetical protein